jgi:predicted transcriptional regulator
MRTDQTVIQAKRFGVFSCRKNKSLLHAAQQMVEEDISALVVVDDDGFLAGIITRTDLLRAFVRFEDWEKQRVESFMNTEVVTVSPQTQLDRVAELLLEKQIHRVVVARNEDGKLRPISVVSAADLVYHMVKDL